MGTESVPKNPLKMGTEPTTRGANHSEDMVPYVVPSELCLKQFFVLRWIFMEAFGVGLVTVFYPWVYVAQNEISMRCR